MVAQGSHASMAFLSRQVKDSKELIQVSEDRFACTIYLSKAELAWVTSSFKKVVVGVKSEEELNEVVRKVKEAGLISHEVIDNGLTEFHGIPTLTCSAIGPDEEEKIDIATKDLILL